MNDLVDKCNGYIIDNARLSEQLAASQVREKVLRDAITSLIERFDLWTCSLTHRAWDIAIKDTLAALNQPTDDTALKALIHRERVDTLDTYKALHQELVMKAALKAERERCAKKAEQLGKDLAEMNEDSSMKFVGGSIAAAIRELEDEC
jgi:hypothetical protein